MLSATTSTCHCALPQRSASTRGLMTAPGTVSVMQTLGPDFFDDASALLPLLALTKVAERVHKDFVSPDNGEDIQLAPDRQHLWFMAIFLIGEGLALTAALSNGVRAGLSGALLAVGVGIALFLCGVLFAIELWRHYMPAAV